VATGEYTLVHESKPESKRRGLDDRHPTKKETRREFLGQ
jgi:hypothetical protein